MRVSQTLYTRGCNHPRDSPAFENAVWAYNENVRAYHQNCISYILAFQFSHYPLTSFTRDIAFHGHTKTLSDWQSDENKASPYTIISIDLES